MLLVGGDSFGRFDNNHPHWATIISNGNAKSVAIGGRDISTTSYATMQELYKNTYTHCIFFITSFGRIGMQTNKQNEIDIDLSLNFKNVKKRVGEHPHQVDPSGKSIVKTYLKS